MGWGFTQGGGLGGLALGYLLAAPPGRPNGERGHAANPKPAHKVEGLGLEMPAS